MKKILLSALATFLVIGLVATGTFAWFQDTETSSGNTFTAGTFDLKIRDQDETWGDGVTATWTATNMAPGDGWAFTVPFVGLTNYGSIVGDHLEITCDYAVIEEVPQTEADTDPNTNLNPDSMAKFMEITRAEYFNSDYKINLLTGGWGYDLPAYPEDPPFPPGYVAGDWTIIDFDGDGRITFFDLKNLVDVVDDLPSVDGTHYFEMDVQFSSAAGNDFQGDTFNLTMFFTLNQDSSQ